MNSVIDLKIVGQKTGRWWGLFRRTVTVDNKNDDMATDNGIYKDGTCPNLLYSQFAKMSYIIYISSSYKKYSIDNNHIL